MNIPFLRDFLVLCTAVPVFSFGQAPTVAIFEAVPSDVIKGGVINLEWETIGADSVSIDQGVGGDLAGTGTVGFPIGGESVIVPASAVWKYMDDGGASLGDTGSEIVVGDPFYGSSNWKHPDYDDSGWKEGVASLGYGDNQTTEILFGPLPDNVDNDPTQKFLAYYFRHEFTLTADDFDDLDLVLMEVQRDDGAIVYINGVQILSSSMPPGFVDSTTEAEVTAGGAAETTFFRQVLDPSVLREGANTVAIEVHQASETSSDLTMNFRLLNVKSGVIREQLIGPDTEWSYLDDGGESLAVTSSDVVDGHLFFNASNWKHPDFDDTAWKSGFGVFGYDTTGFNENSLIEFGGDPRNKILTYYFRKKFTIADQAELDAIAAVTANLVRDDGGVVYVNGHEIGRSNMAAAPTVISSTTRSGGTIGSETADNPLPFDPALLVVGENVISVEVHQSSPTSSDVSFDLSLVAEDAVAVPTELISKESDWRYLDDGSALDVSNVVVGNPAYDAGSWKHKDFDDSSWQIGFGELGYGDGSGTPQAFTTELEYRARLHKFPTAYFRADFDASLAALAAFDDIEIRYRRDDGVIIYLNGTEVVRDNVAEGTIDRDSAALGNAADDGATFISATIPKGVLREGRNVISAELHQALPAAGGDRITSSDTVFDLLLAGVRSASSATYTLTATNANGTTESQATVQFIDPPEGKVFLTTSNVAGLDWGMSGVWSNGAIPDPDTDYIVYPSFAPVVRVPDGGFFEGRSLEIAGKYGILALGGTGDLVHLIMNGGQIWNESGGGDISALGFPGEFGTRIEILDDVIVQNRGSDRILDLSGNLEGSGNIAILAPNTNTNPSLTGVIFSGGNVGYTGTISALDSVLANDGPNLGSGAVIIGDGAVLSAAMDFESAASASVEIAATGGIELSNVLRIATGKLTIDGNLVPDGVYTAASLDGLGFGGVFNDLGAVLIVGEVTFVDADNDSMDDTWEVSFFGNIGVSDGTGDADGDGRTDLNEFLASTDPTSAASALTISSARRATATGDATIVWIGQPGVVYRSQYSDDLVTWSNFSATFSGVGPHSFTDDGSESVPVPSLVERRYYRVEVVRF